VNTAPFWIGPSILTADLLHLGQQIKDAEAAGVDYMHLDVMDGRYVPNISFGLPVATAVRAATSLPLDVHLMIVEPETYAERFVAEGADIVTIHVEACRHLHRTLRGIAEAGATPGIALNPGTSLATIDELLPFVGQILLMSVNPGFGGQTFIPTVLQKIWRLRQMLDQINPACRIQVDGGINVGTISGVAKSGADMVVIGSAIYAPEVAVAEAVRSLREALSGNGTDERSR
jgi:ribulose-phosphate 3-epimerase